MLDVLLKFSWWYLKPKALAVLELEELQLSGAGVRRVCDQQGFAQAVLLSWEQTFALMMCAV